MKSKIAILCIICIAMAGLTACGGKKQPANSNTAESVSSVDILEVKDKMLEADGKLPVMSLASGKDEKAAELFAYLADFDYDKVEDYFFSYAAAGTAEEIAVVKLKNASDADALSEALLKHISTRVKQFETYDPTQVDMAKAGMVFKNGNYCVLIICADKEAVKKAFYDAINN